MSDKFSEFFTTLISNRSAAESLETLYDFDRLVLKALKTNYLDSFWQNRPNKRDMFIICFKKEILANLGYDEIRLNLDSSINEALLTNNIIEVDNNFSVIDSKNIEGDLHQPLINHSYPEKIAFFFGEEGIDTCIDGRHIDKINIFYSEKDLASYAKKYLITDLDKVLALYQNQKLTSPETYGLFFAHLAEINRIDPKSHKNVLRNKPEKYFRDHLQAFLNENTKHDFYKEIEWPSVRETDLFTEWEGKKYFIEIKWLGISIDKDGSKFTQPVTDHSARSGVTQTLKYIEELITNANLNLKCGHLLVFDARDEKKEINYRNFTFIESKYLNYYRYNFKLLKKLDVSNLHPS